MPGPLVLVDADCGFCQRAASWAPRLRLRTGVRAMQDVDLVSLGVDPRRATQELPFVGADGAVLYGHRAVAAALQTGDVAIRIVGRILGSALLERPASAAYRWTARNRGSLPGGTPACSVAARTAGGVASPPGRERRRISSLDS